jgi:hypothetical protein
LGVKGVHGWRPRGYWPVANWPSKMVQCEDTFEKKQKTFGNSHLAVICPAKGSLGHLFRSGFFSTFIARPNPKQGNEMQ